MKLIVSSRSHGACVSSSVLLVETVAINARARGRGSVDDEAGNMFGIVRAVAPLSGCRAVIDHSHKKWLHVRVRPPFSCLAAVAREVEAWGKGGTAARRRLQDGHWTLAFADEGMCAAAKRMVEERASMLRRACGVTLQPLLS